MLGIIEVVVEIVQVFWVLALFEVFQYLGFELFWSVSQVSWVDEVLKMLTLWNVLHV